MKLQRPKPQQKSGKMYCPVDGCKHAPFDSLSSYNMHYLRVHDLGFKRKFNRAVMTRKNLNSKPIHKHTTDGRNLFEIMLSVLTAKGKPMFRSELISACHDAGYAGKLKSTYLSQIVRQKPDKGIIQPARGVYAIGTPEQDYRYAKRANIQTHHQPSASQDHSSNDMSVEVEMQILRRQKLKSQEIIMKMHELLLLAID